MSDGLPGSLSIRDEMRPSPGAMPITCTRVQPQEKSRFRGRNSINVVDVQHRRPWRRRRQRDIRFGYGSVTAHDDTLLTARRRCGDASAASSRKSGSRPLTRAPVVPASARTARIAGAACQPHTNPRAREATYRDQFRQQVAERTHASSVLPTSITAMDGNDLIRDVNGAEGRARDGFDSPLDLDGSRNAAGDGRTRQVEGGDCGTAEAIDVLRRSRGTPARADTQETEGRVHAGGTGRAGQQAHRLNGPAVASHGNRTRSTGRADIRGAVAARETRSRPATSRNLLWLHAIRHSTTAVLHRFVTFGATQPRAKRL